MPFEIIKDSREKAGHGFEFRKSTNCTGMVRKALKTGDYTLTGLEDVVCIERKESTSEICSNLCKPDLIRFEKELARMATFKMAVIILEFDMDDLLAFPRGSGIPAGKQRFIKARGPYLLKIICELQARYPNTHWIFAGSNGQAVALAFLKQAWADYGS